MKVFVCYQYSYDFCNTWEIMQHIFADECKAIDWVAEFTPVKYEEEVTDWRDYAEVEVE